MQPPTRLRIAIVSPIEWRTPPRHYGSRELLVSSLAEGLVSKGMDVTLFATADSLTSGKLRAICPRPLREDPALDVQIWNQLHLSEAFERAGQFDVIHCHDFEALSYCGLTTTPLVLSLFHPVAPRQLPIFHKYANRATYVGSHPSSHKSALRYTASILPGITLDDYKLTPTHGEYLLFVGRIAPHRGIEEAIEAAKLSHLPLLIGGPVQDTEYFEHQIKPLLDGKNLSYYGPVAREKRSEVFGRALALVHLRREPDSYRLAIIEAMACGTPIIATREGLPAGMVKHRETGFLLNSPGELIEAVDFLSKLDRRKIRHHVITYFNRSRMVEEYLAIYQQAIQQARKSRQA